MRKEKSTFSPFRSRQVDRPVAQQVRQRMAHVPLHFDVARRRTRQQRRHHSIYPRVALGFASRGAEVGDGGQVPKCAHCVRTHFVAVSDGLESGFGEGF